MVALCVYEDTVSCDDFGYGGGGVRDSVNGGGLRSSVTGGPVNEPLRQISGSF